LDIAAGDTRYTDLVGELLRARTIGHDRGLAECVGLQERGIPVVRGDVRALGFADEIADITVAFEVIEHLSELHSERMLAELFRVTKPGGTLLLSTPNRYALESVKGILRYFIDGTVWNARDETHLRLFSRRSLLAALHPWFDVQRTYGYYLVDPGGRRLPFSHLVTANALASNLCFILFVVATRRDTPLG
jgi:SAM-dependent methyltransferase